ncbi:pyridoxal phosphate-dependent aminotransferase [Parvularcula marina]|uniref:Aminotransferase n=1 Tax=Parvularcula marina TaxID=2292771 RepID=A0A371RLG8_9PROT|nr:aminotransferase class I/II-fold pyridoxal phosphate-dependent enzyme [Parvularcula marina]RFB06309.1 aminotransferase class I/II-fold pyridoxal phosphate-dependent enzyme [Parvularcula marina]
MRPEIRPFHAMTIGAAAFRMQEAGEPVIHMEYGQPSARPPEAVMDAARAMLDDGVKGYWESDELKSLIAGSYSELHGSTVAPENVILTCGASPALSLALMTAFDPGARIAMARPGYVAHRNVVTGLHMHPVELPCDAATGFQLTASMLAGLDPAPDGVILASPANPTGSIIPRMEMEKIADLCRERNIRIISDEIYIRLTYGEPAASISEFTGDAFIVNSFSKYYVMPGWRLGWVVVPEEHRERAVAYMSNFFLTPPSLSQEAGIASFRCTEELDALIGVYRRNRQMLLEKLPALGMTEMAPPDGAFYIYGRVDQFTDDSRDLCLELLKDTGVATASGVDFDPVEGHRFMRFSFAVTEQEVAQALERITPWFTSKL